MVEKIEAKQHISFSDSIVGVSWSCHFSSIVGLFVHFSPSFVGYFALFPVFFSPDGFFLHTCTAFCSVQPCYLSSSPSAFPPQCLSSLSAPSLFQVFFGSLPWVSLPHSTCTSFILYVFKSSALFSLCQINCFVSKIL